MRVLAPLVILLAGCDRDPAKVTRVPGKKPDAVVRRPEPAPLRASPKADPEASLERWITVLQNPASADRIQAAQEIGRLGPAAKKAIPALADALDVPLDLSRWKQRHPGKDEQQHAAAVALHREARDALIAIGPDSAKALIAAVRANREDPPRGVCNFRSAVESALQRWAPEIIPVLLEDAAEWDAGYYQNPSLKVLVRLGPEAVPDLRKALHDQRPALRARAAALLGDLGPQAAEAADELRVALKDADPNVRLAAAYTLCDRVADDRDRVFPVLLALFQEVPPTMPRILPLAGFSITASPWPVLAGRAAHTKIWMEPRWIAWAPGPSPVHRVRIAGKLLSEYGPKAEVVVPRLVEWIEHSPTGPTEYDLPPWFGTVYGLGPVAKSLAPALVNILRRAAVDEREWDRVRPVWRALESLGPSAAEDKGTVPALVAMLKENPESVAVTSGLRYIGPAAGDLAAPILRGMLKHKDPEVRWRAFQTLAIVSPKRSVEAVPALARFPTAFKNTPQRRLPSIHWCMALPESEASKVWHDLPAFETYNKDLTKALQALGPKDRDAVPILAGLLPMRDPEHTAAVFEFFGRLESDAAGEVIPVALGRVGFADRRVLARCIEHFGIAGAPALADALRSKSRSVRELAGELLGKLGPEAKSVVPAIRTALKNGPDDEQLPAIEVLGRIGPEAGEAVPEMIKLIAGGKQQLLVDSQKVWTSTTARALGRIGKVAVPPLIEALKDPNPLVRSGAAEALGRIGPDAMPAVVHLLRLRDSEREPAEVREAARKTLNVLDPD